ncbi:MAG TPA: polyprenyl synthetase family protein [Candidatus Marinimicrobia bacterium]|nr:polyprenyl synthetase family protein [Candidatus Neomarinimicrobiota bacterium]
MTKETLIQQQLILPELIRLDMAEIEKRLVRAANSDNKTMRDIISASVTTGGKRLRPMLILSTFRALNGQNLGNAYYGATALELIHSASLIHDDIIDQATHRRGVPTAFDRFGLAPALLAGDFLFVEGYGMASNLPNHIVQSVVISLKKLGEGQLAEEMLDSRKPSFEEYQEIITNKTAYLFWGSCRMGSQLADAPEDTVEKISEAGLNLGVAFQYIDDILDVIGDLQLTGKPAGTDFFTHKLSLPYYLFLDVYGDLPEKRTSEEFEKILPLLRSDSVMKPAKQMAAEYTQKALSQFEKLPENEISRFLIQLGQQMLERVN